MLTLLDPPQRPRSNAQWREPVQGQLLEMQAKQYVEEWQGKLLMFCTGFAECPNAANAYEIL